LWEWENVPCIRTIPHLRGRSSPGSQTKGTRDRSSGIDRPCTNTSWVNLSSAHSAKKKKRTVPRTEDPRRDEDKADSRIRPILSPRTPPSLTQRTQIRNLHHNARVLIREERRYARVRIQQGQLETPPAAGPVVVAAAERHLVQSCGWVVCGFPGASTCGNVVLCGTQDSVNIPLGDVGGRAVIHTFGRS